MSIEHKINVNTHYTRSVNLKRDAGSESIVNSYIPTSRALKTLELFSHAFKEDESPRAWSLIGPYGSGKSSFASFLSNLLEKDNSSINAAAYKVLSRASVEISKEYKTITENGSGCCVVLLTGSPDSLGKRLIHALHQKSQQIWNIRRGKKPKILGILSESDKQKECPTVNEITDLVEAFQEALTKIGYSGLFIAIDELGKFLEYETRHAGADNIYLLQELAELAKQKHSTKLALMVMLHQSIEQYARGLGATLKTEWAKVQGRFESISFLETSEQTLRVVAKAISHNFTKKESKQVKSQVISQVNVLFDNGALPSSMNKKMATNLFVDCYPLHPICALILPILCQKVAQNERTLFSYLGSKESHGFLDSLSNLESIGEQIEPWEIYEYFIRNQPISASDHFTERRWIEVDTAINRLGDAKAETIKLLKLIGLLNIIGNQGGLKASKNLLEICASNNKSITGSLTKLKQKSIISYRRFNSEYRVWQGSDFDIVSSIEEERGKLGFFSIAEKLNERHEILPIVARKYSILNGTLRYFLPKFISKDTYKEELNINSRYARVIFYLAETGEDQKFFKNELISQFNSDLLVLCPNGELARETLTEVLALEQIERSSQELKDDPVAKREFSDNYGIAKENELNLLSSLMYAIDENEWYWRSKKQKIKNKNSLQQIFSEILEEIYNATPIIRNEIINRRYASSQANAARKKLINALLINDSKEDLAIDKFPAEKAIYRALLKETGLHFLDKKSNKWKLAQLTDLDKKNDNCNFLPIWEKIDGFFKSTEKQAKTFVELSQELQAPPYGIKLAVLPLLQAIAILAYKEKLAVTEENVFIPYLGEEHFDRFFKRADQFKIQYVDMGGVNQEYINQYSIGLFEDEKKRKEITMLEIVAPMAKFIESDLEYYTSQTKNLTPATKAFRDAFKFSKSPYKLLLEDIPKALGAEIEKNDGVSLADQLRISLTELKYAFQGLKDDMASTISESFGLDGNMDLSEIRKNVSARCFGLDKYTIDELGQKGFIQRTQKTNLDDDTWLESLLAFCASKPVQKWSDSDRNTVQYKITILASDIMDLHKLRFSHEDSKKTSREGDTFIIKSMKFGHQDLEEVVIIEEKLRSSSAQTKKEILDILNKSDSKIAMAALTEAVDEYLSRKNKNARKGSKKALKSDKIDKDESNEVA